MARIEILYHSVSENLHHHMAGRLVSELDSGTKIDLLMPSVNHIRSFKDSVLPNLPYLLPGQLFLGTFFAWANRILDAEKQSFRIISTGEEWLLLFGYIRKHPELFPDTKPGSLSLIQKIITELRETDLSLKQLNNLSEKYPEIAAYIGCVNFLMDIAKTRHLASSSSLLLLVAESLSHENFKPGAGTLIVAGFYEFNAIQRRILNLLIDRYQHVILYYPEKSDHPAMKFIPPLPDILGWRKFQSKKIVAGRQNTFQRIAGSLFNVLPNDKDERKDSESLSFNLGWQDVSLKVLRCPTRRLEVDAAARTIKTWIRAGIAAEDIAVIYRDPHEYPSLIRLIFPALGIPLSRKEYFLQETSPVRILQKIIDINEQNYSRDSVVDLTRFKEIRDIYGNEIIQKFEYRSGAWGLSFSKDSWRTQLKQRREYLQSVLNVTDDESRDARILRRELQEIDTLLPVLRRFLDDIELPSGASWSEYIQRIRELIQTYFSADSESAEVINKILEILKNLSTLVDDSTIVNLRHFSMAFNMLISGVGLPLSEHRAQTGVVIDELMNVRHRRFRAVILLGLVDTEFPVDRRDNPLMNRQRRSRFNQITGVDLFRSPSGNIEEEKFLFYYLMSRIDDCFLITYPQFDGNNRNFAVSPFLDELRTIAKHKELKANIRFESLAATSVIPELPMIASADDLYLNLQYYDWEEADRVFLSGLLEDARLNIIRQKVEVEDQRRQHLPSIWNGRLSLLKHRDFCFEYPLSVTRLQQYAWCPFLYLCESIWKIDTVEEPVTDIPAISDGILIHALLERFLRSANAHNSEEWRAFISGNLEAKKAQVLSTIDTTYRTVFAHIDDLIWKKKMKDLKQGLDRFIRRETEALDSEYYPSDFEITYKYFFPIIVENREINVPFKVKIDRIDRKFSDRFTLIEYKRSKYSVQDPMKGVDEGIHFQIPVYLMAYQNQNPDLHCAGAYSYIFNEGKIAKGIFTEKMFARQPVITEAEFEALLEKTRNKVEELLYGIYRGDFFLNPYDVSKRCQHNKCPYFELCRVDSGMGEDDE